MINLDVFVEIITFLVVKFRYISFEDRVTERDKDICLNYCSFLQNNKILDALDK